MRLKIYRRVPPSTTIRFPWMVDVVADGMRHRIIECENHEQALGAARSLTANETPLLDADGNRLNPPAGRDA